jgi:hypothetical protein
MAYLFLGVCSEDTLFQDQNLCYRNQNKQNIREIVVGE